MSIQAISWALKQRLSPAYKFTLVALSSYADPQGESAFMSHNTLAEDTGYSRRTIITHLQNLIELGYIELIEKRPNQYQQTLEFSVEIEGEDKPALIAEWISQFFT